MTYTADHEDVPVTELYYGANLTEAAVDITGILLGVDLEFAFSR